LVNQYVALFVIGAIAVLAYWVDRMTGGGLVRMFWEST